MNNEIQKPVIGFSCGDINGIGIELIIKSLADSRVLDICTPVVFASNKSINFYRKSMPDINFSYQHIKDFSRLSTKQINLFNCWEEEVPVSPGQLNDMGGHYALLSLQQAAASLKAGDIQALVTAPIHKKNIQSEAFNYSGHTPYLKAFFNVPDVVMVLTAENMRVALLTEHVPVSEVAKYITNENIHTKLHILNNSLKKDMRFKKEV